MVFNNISSNINKSIIIKNFLVTFFSYKNFFSIYLFTFTMG